MATPRKKPRRRATRATPKKDWQRASIEALASGSTVSEAAKAAGVDRATIYRALERDESFKERFEDAVEQGTDVIESAATQRAVSGVEEPVIYQGQVTFVGMDKDGNACDPTSPLAVKNVPLTVRKPSDTLAIFLLKGRRPHKFRDNVSHEITGKGGGPIETKAVGAPDYDAIEAELRSISTGRMAGGASANN